MKTWKAIKVMWFWLTRYMVVIELESKSKVHWAKNERDALEWLACYYPDRLGMYGKRGKLLGARWM